MLDCVENVKVVYLSFRKMFYKVQSELQFCYQHIF